MSLVRSATIASAVVAALCGQDAFAHGSKQHELATEPGSAAAPEQTATQLTVTIDPEATVAPVVQITRGAHVHLSILGAGENALHLHGYDIEVKAGADQPASVIFDAVHTGRFPLEMHLADDLLGRREKAVLYVEIRDP
jgi:hypothetical protein